MLQNDSIALAVGDVAHLIKSVPIDGEFEIEVRDTDGNVAPAKITQHGCTATGIKVVIQEIGHERVA